MMVILCRIGEDALTLFSPFLFFKRYFYKYFVTVIFQIFPSSVIFQISFARYFLKYFVTVIFSNLWWPLFFQIFFNVSSKREFSELACGHHICTCYATY